MKTHEFARHLDQLARLLRKLPDMELDSKRMPDLQSILSGMELNKKEDARQPKTLPDDIESKLQAMSPAEVEAYLLSEDEAFTAASLSALADRLGLTSVKRQSKSALVNVITRHFEATRMHSIMRGAKPNEA